MKRSNLILRTETYVKELMTERKGDLMIAHDFNHIMGAFINRVPVEIWVRRQEGISSCQ